MSVHDACALYAGGCLRSISSAVSPWYPLVGFIVSGKIFAKFEFNNYEVFQRKNVNLVFMRFEPGYSL